MSAVDVVVPCYNYAHYLEYCVGTILSQRDTDVRVLIIDDKSSDSTEEIGKQLAARDSRVTFHRHQVNQGLIRTANEGGLDWASAPYTLLLSADDSLTPGALARATSVLDAHPDAGMVYGMAKFMGKDEMPRDPFDVAMPTYQILDGARFIERSCMVGNPVATPTAVIRTDLQKRTGGYRPQFPFTSDMEMWMRMATMGPIGIIKDAQGYYRWHGTNQTLDYIKGALGDRRARLATCEYVYNEWSGEKVEGFAGWLHEMKLAFGREALAQAGEAVKSGNQEAYRECMAFVDEYSPDLYRSASWWKLVAKRSLGPSGMRAAQSALGGLRRLVKPQPAAANPWGQSGELFGWWPEVGQAGEPGVRQAS
jgi:GT2 family glycosyltransferase